eukprot:SAG31_NODE_32518_length_355_cov_0.437500_1_plen_56_part_00
MRHHSDARPDYYAALGIEKNASGADIRAAYRKLARAQDMRPPNILAAIGVVRRLI